LEKDKILHLLRNAYEGNSPNWLDGDKAKL
jgi:hypothetical protein